MHNQLKISKITTMKDEKELVTYCGEEVELLEITNSNQALIRFENGREDEVPLKTIKF